MHKTLRAFDTETDLIYPGNKAPALVCLQEVVQPLDETWLAAEPVLHHHTDVNPERFDFDEEGSLWVLHTSYDLAVLCAHDKGFIQPIFRALAQYRITDTFVREMLLANAEGTLTLRRKQRGSFSLGTLAKKYSGRELDKGGPERTSYAALREVPVSQWPQGHVDYALNDARAEVEVYLEQGRRVGKPDPQALSPWEVSPDEYAQTAAAFALYLASVWGCRVDPVQWQKMHDDCLRDREQAEKLVQALNVIREDGSLNKKRLQELVVDACVKRGKPVPMTDHATKPQVKTDAETLESLADQTPELNAVVTRAQLDKLVSTYIEPLKFGMTGPLNTKPNVLVGTGRTSWAGENFDMTPYGGGKEFRVGTNLQNFPRKEGIRECIVPREGRWILSVDYDSLEVRTFAQALLWIVGRSGMAARYKEDPNFDPHTDFASDLIGIPYKEGLLRKEKDKSFKKGPRQMAKAGVFGIPGGMGAEKFVAFAKSDYGVDLTLQQAIDLKERYLQKYPEVKEYFRFIGHCTNHNEPFRQLVSGRIRGDVGFCDGCNTYFQGLAADGSKRALFAVSMACYAKPDSALFGSRVISHIHDENVLEVPIVSADLVAKETVLIMEQEMQRFVPDVPIRASPALSTRWIKAAEAVYGADGKLTAWDL